MLMNALVITTAIRTQAVSMNREHIDVFAKKDLWEMDQYVLVS